MTGCLTELQAKPIGTWCNHYGELEENVTAARGQRRQRSSRRGMACLWASTQGTAVPGHGEPQGVLQTAIYMSAAVNDETRYGLSADSARQGHDGRDAEVTMKQAVF